MAYKLYMDLLTTGSFMNENIVFFRYNSSLFIYQQMDTMMVVIIPMAEDNIYRMKEEDTFQIPEDFMFTDLDPMVLKHYLTVNIFFLSINNFI